MVQSLDGSPSYRAVNCDSNNYGRSALTYGLEVYPCKPCPSGVRKSQSGKSERMSKSVRALSQTDSVRGGVL